MSDYDTTAADQVVAALRSGHDELVPIVAGLTEQELTGPSAASEWDISQVISHLGSGAVIGKAVLDAALAGNPPPGPEFNQAVWDRWNAMSATDRAAEFPVVDTALVEAYQGLDPRTRAEQRIDLGFLPAPVDVATAGKFRLNEFTLHSWDVRVAADPAATLRPDAVALLLDMLPMLVGFLGKTAPLDGRTVAVGVTLTDLDRRLGLSIADGVSLIDAPGEPDATLALPAEAWVRLVTGRLSPLRTPSTVSATGIDLDTLREVFPGF
jgi:uncharacterized protein (TIGR03083 family)